MMNCVAMSVLYCKFNGRRLADVVIRVALLKAALVLHRDTILHMFPVAHCNLRTWLMQEAC